MKKTFILCMSLIILVLSGCGNTVSASQPASSVPVSQTPAVEPTTEPTYAPVPTEEPVETYIIDFAGLQLKYPVKWRESVSVTVTDNKASFACGEVPLFDLLANSDEGYVLGTVCGEEYTVLSIQSYDIENTDNVDLYAMEEDVNVIIDNLIKDYDFVVGVAVDNEDSSIFDIETSVVTMKYPAKWQGIVTVDVSEEKVSFSNNGTPLFDLVFSECDGFLLGAYSGTPIYIVDYPVTTDEQAAMQEDVNVILQYLMEDSNFVINA